MATLMLPTDGCPQCVSGIPVHPYEVGHYPDGHCVRTWYRCPECGHQWMTNWAPEAVDLQCPGCPECQPLGRSA